jgi:hypothetical protein
MVLVVERRFGPRLSERELRRMNDRSDPALALHAGCWINDYDCGDPGCVMGLHGGEPELVDRQGREVSS